jgi:hypothetical protein
VRRQLLGCAGVAIHNVFKRLSNEEHTKFTTRNERKER